MTQIILSIICIFVAIVFSFKFLKKKKEDWAKYDIFIGFKIILISILLLLTSRFFINIFTGANISTIKCNKVKNTCMIQQKNIFNITLNKKEINVTSIDSAYIDTYQVKERRFRYRRSASYHDVIYYDINIKQKNGEEYKHVFGLATKDFQKAENTLHSFEYYLKNPDKTLYTHIENNILLIVLIFFLVIIVWFIFLLEIHNMNKLPIK